MFCMKLYCILPSENCLTVVFPVEALYVHKELWRYCVGIYAIILYNPTTYNIFGKMGHATVKCGFMSLFVCRSPIHQHIFSPYELYITFYREWHCVLDRYGPEQNFPSQTWSDLEGGHYYYRHKSGGGHCCWLDRWLVLFLPVSVIWSFWSFFTEYSHILCAAFSSGIKYMHLNLKGIRKINKLSSTWVFV